VYDVSHPDMKAQYQHIQQTIKPMIDERRPIIDVANKCDLVKSDYIPKDAIAVSATNLTGDIPVLCYLLFNGTAEQR
jgi:50S ribosomal subunit-associated GTPase HflX